MKLNIKYLLTATVVWIVTSVALSSCDFLDKGPLDDISPDSYHKTADQLAGFTLKYYTSIFPNNRGYWAGVATYDNGTDNQASVDGNGDMFTADRWRVPGSGGIGFNNIRDLNKFINETEAKYAAGGISGSDAMIKHYIGEAYFVRAMLYFGKLKAYGDYPLELEELNVDSDLVAASKRAPRNEVARQILKDLDKAIANLQDNLNNKLRINRRAALVIKSRVALYEGSFELHHRGTGRVPGDANWPGADKEWNKGKSFDQKAEVDFFLSQAMAAAKEVADLVPLSTANSGQMNPIKKGEYNGWNPYYDMFASTDLSVYPEVLLWRQFSLDPAIAHLTSHMLRNGSGTGWTRGLVESFLMKNGLPIYASNSGYHGDKSIDLAKKERDERLQLFVFGESDVLANDQESIDSYNKSKQPADQVTDLVPYEIPTMSGGIVDIKERKDVTGYRQRKFYNYDVAMHLGQSFSDISGQILVRVEEAYLNYIEASYLKNNNLDADAQKYWTALRKRAGITAPIATTIAATDMAYEADVNRASYDWGAFSNGKPVDPTLYSIRRERRSELAGEGYRMDDLIRWAALNQVKNYHIEGVNLWDEMANADAFKKKDKDGKLTNETILIADGGEKSNVSSPSLSKYLRPYQISTEHLLYDGYTFYEAHYLSPFSVHEMELTSPTEKAADSYLYQNLYWPIQTNGIAIK